MKFVEKEINSKSNLYPRIIRKIKSKLRALSIISITFHYKKFSIKLPANHLLKSFHNTHPKYDRFLPHLSKYIGKKETVIDIGANVGDTLAGMAEQNSTLNYICIEPDSYFFNILKQNIKRIKSSVKNLNIRTIKALVGKNITNVKLDGKNGTKHATIQKKSAIKSQSLDEIIPKKKIKLLKSDVDGFDYDVLDSSMSIIKKSKPIIFFECQYNFMYQKLGYIKTLKKLEKIGYCYWIVFDNFGEVIVKTNNINIVIQLIEYIWQQNTGKTTRSIFYYDILTVQKKNLSFINRVVKDYK